MKTVSVSEMELDWEKSGWVYGCIDSGANKHWQ